MDGGRWARVRESRLTAGALFALVGTAAVAPLLGGCGSGSTAPAPAVHSRATEEQLRKMNEVFALLETVEMGEWAAYGRSTLAQGRIRPMDFSSRSANPFGITGVNAIARFEDMTIYVDVTMWQVMPVRLLADVMLDEMAHFFYHTTEHHEYHRLRYQLTTTWEAKFGKPWGYYGTEEQLWNDYLDNPEQFH